MKIIKTSKKFYAYERDGITQSLLATWLSCRYKAKFYLEGWSPTKIKTPLTYGTIIHAVLEAVYNLIMSKKLKTMPDVKLIKKITKEVEIEWLKENPGVNSEVREDLDMCLLIAESTLPLYFKFWSVEDLKKIEWRQLEQQFKIPYTTKDGRKTFIRGKMDGVFGKLFISLFETKTKSLINVRDMIDTLWFDLQNNIYLWAIGKTYKKVPAGIKYNIIRKTGLHKKKEESKIEYAKRIIKDMEKRPSFYFLRLNIKVTQQEMKKFENELEGLVVSFMDWCEGKSPTYKTTNACLGRYGRCQFLDICNKGDYTSYKKRKTVFRELEDL